MEKVILTKKQAEAIEHALQEVDEYKGNPDRLLRHASMNNVNFRNELHLLDTIDIVTLAKALYIGYEVELEFKVGDWVVNANGTIGKITNINEFGEFEGFWEKTEMLCEKDNFVRHATPEEIAEEKERRWWKKHGRDVWELRKGDVLVSDEEEFQEVTTVKEIEGFHFIDYVKTYIETIKRKYRVVCFAEQRLDWEGE